LLILKPPDIGGVTELFYPIFILLMLCPSC